MKETRINSNYVSQIKIIPAVKTDFIWCSELPKKKHWFGFTIQEGLKEGFWYKGNQSFLGERIDTNEYKNFVEVDGVLWVNPFLRVYANGKCIFSRHYENVEEIRQLVSREFPNVNIILS